MDWIADSGGAAREIAKRSMLGYVKYMMPEYEVNWHHELICRYVDDFVSGKTTKLIITIPPQHGKSEITSRMLPSYLFGKNPDNKILLCSYNAEKSEEFNREIQRYLDKPEYHVLFPEVKLQAAGTNSAYVRNTRRFDITGRRGFLKSVGVGGGITGTPVDIAIIDDPVKGREEANSMLTLESIWQWYNSDLLSRLHNGSKQLVIMTRWDSEDLVGRLLNNMADGGAEWTIVNLPAIKENDDNPEDPRQIGEALWANRHGLKKLLEAKHLDARTFQSLYQQNPMPVQVGGECYKDFDRNIIICNTEYNPTLPLHVSFDFNVNPYMPCGVYQLETYSKVLSNGDIKKYYNINMIREYAFKSPKNTTEHICNAICHEFADHTSGMFIYGDPRGMNEDTRSEKGHNDYTVILRCLRKFSPTLRVQLKADHVKTRIGFINAIFRGAIEDLLFRCSLTCNKSIDDWQFIKEDAEGVKFKQLWTDPSTGVRSQRFGHMSDLFEYFICVCFQRQYQKYQYGGADAPKRIVAKIRNKNMY